MHGLLFVKDRKDITITNAFQKILNKLNVKKIKYKLVNYTIDQ